MDEQRLTEAAGKGIAEHQRIIESEGAHGPVAVQGAPAISEMAVGNEQAAIAVADIADDELIAPARQLINQGITIAGIKLPDQLPVRHRLERVVNGESEEQIVRTVAGSKGAECRQQVHIVDI